MFEVETTNALHGHQFWFRRGRSTTDAVSRIARAAREGSRYTRIIVLDIRNAFNSIPWGCIFKTIENRRISLYLRRAIQNYLVDRKLLYYAVDGVVRRRMYKGAPQGSIVGPVLWNLANDDVLRIPMPGGVKSSFCG